ncbi:hypothetical protein I4F81_004573 [Pyropia yezoensis]|uniref:Uncharacterized protein n=1 Tax=Pyropia yezoensis TaxID=2788 RepID=A0ACC3BVS4_PYRYE|nr:hypothetical protein I4F81_004573 [Neopyropia yezoensis]
MKCVMLTLTVLAVLVATASAATVPQVSRQVPPCPQPGQPTPPPPQPWEPSATITVEEGMATATLGIKSCTLSEALPEGLILPPTAKVEWVSGFERVRVQAYPTMQFYECVLQEGGGGDRR